MGYVAVNPEQCLTIPAVSAGAVTQNILGDIGWAAADLDLNQATPTNAPATVGTERNAWLNVANLGLARRIFVVSGGNGATDAGVVGLRVSGTKWDPLTGTRTASQTETLYANITTAALNATVLTSAYFIGLVTFELYTVSGSPVTYNFSFNYGFVAPFTMNGHSFRILGWHAQVEAGAAITDLIVRVFRVSGTPSHTYSAAAFSPTGFGAIDTLWDIDEDELAAAGNQAVMWERGLAFDVEGGAPTSTTHGIVVAMDSISAVTNGYILLFYRLNG